MGQPKFEMVDGTFHHVVVEGSPYEVGQQLAQFVKSNTAAANFFKAAMKFSKSPLKLGFSDFESLQQFVEEHCPGITEELRGLTDGLGVKQDKFPFWGFSCNPLTPARRCSQLALLPSITSDGHLYMGRSYEWTFTEEELMLLTTRVKGKASHIGFSLALASRYDGINEHGFIVSMTGGGIFNVPLRQKGLACWVVIRSLLDQSKSVKDALSKIQPSMISGHFSLVLADARGHAALIEFADGDMEVKQINSDDTEPWIFSVNHYNLPNITKHNKLNCGIITHSTLRQALITDLIKEKRPKISKEDLRQLFATSHPDGLCNYFYRDGFGTLWSMLFDVTERTVDVCFSAPTHNKYHTFGLDSPVGVTAYPVTFPILPWS